MGSFTEVFKTDDGSFVAGQLAAVGTQVPACVGFSVCAALAARQGALDPHENRFPTDAPVLIKPVDHQSSSGSLSPHSHQGLASQHSSQQSPPSYSASQSGDQYS